MAVHFTPVRFLTLIEIRCDLEMDHVLVQSAAANVAGSRVMRQTVHYYIRDPRTAHKFWLENFSINP